MDDKDRELLLYIVAKLVRIDAVLATIHSAMINDLRPADDVMAAARRKALGDFCKQNAKAEFENLKVQFPDLCPVIQEYLSLAEQEGVDAANQRIRELEVEHPDTFSDPSASNPPPEPSADETDETEGTDET